MEKHNLLKKILIIFAAFLFFIVFLNGYNLSIDIFGDRDLIRSFNLDKSFEIYGSEFSMQEGRGMPGGFNYQFIWLVTKFFKDIIYINYFFITLTLICYIYLLKTTYKWLEKTGSLISFIIFFSSPLIIEQTKIFWNPSLGLPFSILGCAFFFEYINKKKNNYLILSLTSIFLASQFHISYIGTILPFSLILIFTKKNIFHLFLIFICSIFAAYIFLFLNIFVPLLNPEVNDGMLIQSISSEIKNNSNIFIDVFKKILLVFGQDKILLISLPFLIIIFRLFKKFENFFDNINYLKIYLIFYTFGLISFVLFFNKLDAFKLEFFGTSLFFGALIAFILQNKIISSKINFDEQKKTYLILSFIIFFSILLSSLSYFFIYKSFRLVIGGRYGLYIFPIYSIYIGGCIVLLINLLKLFTHKFQKIFVFSIIFVLGFKIFFVSYNNVPKNKNLSAYNYVNKKELINNLIDEYAIGKKDLLTRVAMSKIVDGNIHPINKQSFQYYINNLKNYPEKNFNECLLIVHKKINNNKNINYLNKKEVKKAMIKNFDKFGGDIVINHLRKFKHFFIINYNLKNSMSCASNFSNDYILNDKEKNIIKYVKNIKKNSFYKEIINNNQNNYFIKLQENLKIPLNLLFEFKKNNDKIEITLIGKRLRNNSTILNGYWSKVVLTNPEIIFINNDNNTQKRIKIFNGKIGEGFIRSPWSTMVNNISKGNYTIFFVAEKLSEEFNNKKSINIKYEMDENYNH